jgi:signal transduction histidine kinase
MAHERRVDELKALKEIAETLNCSHDMQQMLDAVLSKLLEVTGLTTGWIFLMDEKPGHICVADCNLPPALSWGEKTPMCEGSCWCVDKYWSGRLQNAVNIINCKRIEDAIEQDWGDTKGIHHHATVPLKAGEEWFGLLNVASPGKNMFTDEELTLLESVAFQIGTAIKRTKLYHAEQKRAESYAKVGEIGMRLGNVLELNKIPGETVKRIGESFPWSSVAYFVREENELSCRAHYVEGKTSKEWHFLKLDDAGPVGDAIRSGRTKKASGIADEYPALRKLGLPLFRSAIAVPLRQGGQVQGALLVTSQKTNGFDEIDVAVLKSLADHITIARENAKLTQQRGELGKWEERNRLARDLHDSVCQNLFSLSLMTRGLESVLAGTNELVEQSLREIQRVTEEAHKEMRSLIWQLRPAGLEQGLFTALKAYGERVGLTVRGNPEGVCELPRAIEETLWRIGQEALNNVSKHAAVREVTIFLKNANGKVQMEIRDKGKGFSMAESGRSDSLGLISMRERAEMVGGHFSVESAPGSGTRVRVSIPYHNR